MTFSNQMRVCLSFFSLFSLLSPSQCFSSLCFFLPSFSFFLSVVTTPFLSLCPSSPSTNPSFFFLVSSLFHSRFHPSLSFPLPFFIHISPLPLHNFMTPSLPFSPAPSFLPHFSFTSLYHLSCSYSLLSSFSPPLFPKTGLFSSLKFLSFLLISLFIPLFTPFHSLSPLKPLSPPSLLQPFFSVLLLSSLLALTLPFL